MSEQSALFPIYARPEFVLDRGEGVFLYDTEGRRYLDCVAGIAVNALGYGDREVLETLRVQAARLIHVSNLYHTVPAEALARALVERSNGLDRAYFCNSGSEAVETALKLARLFARRTHGEGKTTFVAFDGAFHGRTMGAVAVTSREAYRRPYEPVMPDVRFARFNDVEGVDEAIGPQVCAVLVEPVQGEGGVRVASDAFLQRLRARCDEVGALLVFDEIQCGMGRTGTLWAHEPVGVVPDIMVLAKPLAGGLPAGAVLAREAVATAMRVGEHGTTFGGGPLATAVAGVVLRRISAPEFLAHVQRVAAYLDTVLHTLARDHAALVAEVRGRGLLRGIQVRGSAAAIRQRCHNKGVLVATSGDDVVRLLPPLIIEETHIDILADALHRVFATL